MQAELAKLPTRIWLGVCVLLALVVLAEWLMPRSEPGDVLAAPSAATEAPLPLPSKYTAPAIHTFAATFERPVFFPDRRLPAKPEAVAAPRPLDLDLEGVAIVAERRIALLRERKTRETLQLAEGTDHAGWKLTSVTTKGATFERGAEVTELELVATERPAR